MFVCIEYGVLSCKTLFRYFWEVIFLKGRWLSTNSGFKWDQHGPTSYGFKWYWFFGGHGFSMDFIQHLGMASGLHNVNALI